MKAMTLLFYLIYAGNDGYYQSNNYPPMLAGYGMIQMNAPHYPIRKGDTIKVYAMTDSTEHIIWLDHNKFNLVMPSK